MPKGFEYKRTKFTPSGYSPSGGGPTGVGELSKAGGYIQNFGGIRSKTIGINDIPTTGVMLNSQEESTKLMADAQVAAAQ